MRLVERLALLGAAAVFVSGCSTMNGMKDNLGSSDMFKNPAACAVAGGLLAGAVGAVENKEAMAIGAVAGGLLGWWACDSQDKPLPDADKDGVADKADVCADTPAGAKVASNGCPENMDTDGDGVADTQDKCAATPKGSAVDATGCVPTTDGDSDGVPDTNDLCPNTPAGAAVLSNGCEMDSDSDGIPDSRDRCAGTPAGVKVGSDGCAADTDGDGVSDVLDRCPNTKAGAKVDAAGCEAAGAGGTAAPTTPATPATPAAPKGAAATGAAATVVPTTPGDSIVLKGVNFEPSSAKLTRDSLFVLNNVADQLKAGKVKVEVSGHTDSSGAVAINRALSQRRAEVVMSYLVAKGVPAESLSAKGYGPDKPVGDNKTAAGRSQNRRVELKVME